MATITLKFEKVIQTVDGSTQKRFTAENKQGRVSRVYGWFSHAREEDYVLDLRIEGLAINNDGYIQIVDK